MISLEARLAVLERRVARTRRMLVVVGLVAIGVSVGASTNQVSRQEASEFVVVGRSGEVRARLTETGLYVMDETGREALALSLANGRGSWAPGLSLYYPAAEERSAQSRVTLHRNFEGGVDLVMSGGTENGRVEISVSESGEPSIVATGPDGRVLWSPF